MAVDALKNVVVNTPDWIKRLAELNADIDKRQDELEALRLAEEGQGNATTKPKSLRNKGSTESLKPKDDGNPFLSSPVEPTPTEALAAALAAARSGAITPPEPNHMPPPSQPSAPTSEPAAPKSPGSGTPTALQRQTQQVKAVAQKRARAQVRKKHRSESLVSAEGAPATYRSRSMVIVYYDSYVQIFFEEFVKFVSASRNLMRKAKMAAKVAQIKRLAELEMPDEDEDDPSGEAADGKLTPLPISGLMGARGLRSMRGGLPSFAMAGGRSLLGNDATPDAYDELDKGLEFVQSMAEHAAHQFLRAGECEEEIRRIQERLESTKALAEKELERVMREEPESMKESNDFGKPRTLRHSSMRREQPSKDAANTAPTTPVPEMPPKLEVDPMLVADDDEGVEDMDNPPVLVYKSTRLLRSATRNTAQNLNGMQR